jgi:hypothetical protein
MEIDEFNKRLEEIKALNSFVDDALKKHDQLEDEDPAKANKIITEATHTSRVLQKKLDRLLKDSKGEYDLSRIWTD